MNKWVVVLAVIGLQLSGGHLAGQKMENLHAASYLHERMEPGLPLALEPEAEAAETEEAWIIEEELTPATEYAVADSVETPAIIDEPATWPEINESAASEVEAELTYDQMNQRDSGTAMEEPVPPEVIESWYMETTAQEGLAAILAAYEIPEYTFILDSNPSNFVYQYEFYTDSPDGGHVNLLGVFQYDATGKQTFQLNPLTGTWE